MNKNNRLQEQRQLAGDAIRYAEQHFGPLAKPLYPMLARIFDINVELSLDPSTSCGCRDLEPVSRITSRLVKQSRGEQLPMTKRGNHINHGIVS